MRTPEGSSIQPQTPVAQQVNTTQVQSQPWVAKWAAETHTQSRVCLPVDISHLVPGAIFMAAESQNKQNTNDWCQDSRPSSYFPLSPELQGNLQKNLKWGKGFCPFSRQHEARPTTLGNDWVKRRQESRNCLWPAPSAQQVLLCVPSCTCLHLCCSSAETFLLMCSVLRPQLPRTTFPV